MSLQWSGVATFLYGEVFLVLLLCVPFISAKRWQQLFRSRAVSLLVSHGNSAFICLLLILTLLLIDAFHESGGLGLGLGFSPGGVPGQSPPHAPPLVPPPPNLQMKLFRAQRNLHLAGFSLLLCCVLRRLVSLLSLQAQLGASFRAVQRQAEGAGRAARACLETNTALRKQLAGGGDGADPPPESSETSKLREEVGSLRGELETAQRALAQAQGEVRALQLRSQGLSREFHLLLERHRRLQESLEPPRDRKGQ